MKEFKSFFKEVNGNEGSNANLSIEKENKTMELKVNEYNLPGQILFNYKELKEELTEKVSVYETLVYTDDNIKEAKADRANLNKLKKALNDERIRREKEYMQPFNDFKTKINEIIGIIDKPVAVIDKQVKEFEEQKKAEKMEAIKEYWTNLLEVPDGLALEEIFDNKWLNASVSMKSIQDAITASIDKFNQDMATLANLPEFGFEAQQVYISSLDLNKALAEGQRMTQIAKAKAEREEAMRKIAEEQRKAEEAKKAELEAAATQEQTPGQVEPERMWVSFSALLTTEDALALKNFFESRDIEFKAI